MRRPTGISVSGLFDERAHPARAEPYPQLLPRTKLQRSRQLRDHHDRKHRFRKQVIPELELPWSAKGSGYDGSINDQDQQTAYSQRLKKAQS
ncbi:hypothetical protein NDU88_007800 [Pleurodeles waltl]|uniref:Uncharacterized protein n=1 Tax=Pleurodeles waltl TaxID=8319 RepID=A0AAV7U177_PLEWA|nr:hypothetical protein NDU88_007800 [Pleurodeles waltl]